MTSSPAKYSGTAAPTSDLVRSSNWSGFIPVVVTLAPTSLGTTMMPHPIHILLNRGTYLHLGLKSVIQRLHKFAPATLSFDYSSSAGGMIKRIHEPAPQGDDDDDNKDNDNANNNNDANNNNHDSFSSNNNSSTQIAAQQWKFPVCWFEDEETQIPLRWHIFAGVVFDMLSTSKQPQSSFPMPLSSSLQHRIPWKIRLHFYSYPSSEILPLEPDQVWTSIERSFKNSLKEALFLQYGNSKVAMNMSKQVHKRLWDALESSNYKLYQQINVDLQATVATTTSSSGVSSPSSSIQFIPVRLFLDSKPPIQRPCRATIMTVAGTDGDNKGDIPLDSNPPTTLGSLLADWLPDLFRPMPITTNNNNNNNNGDVENHVGAVVEPVCESYEWIVAGIKPPLSIPILELWQNLCHPDHFLYITVLTR